MKKILFSLILLASLCLAMISPVAAEMKNYNYPEISMLPPGPLMVNKWNFMDNFPTAGCCYIRSNAVAVMVVTGKLPDLASMQNTMVKLSGVALNKWQLADQAQNDMRGWVWRKEYQTMVGDKLVYTVLGHGTKHAYLLMLYADKGDYSAWRSSLRVVNSNPDTPR